MGREPVLAPFSLRALDGDQESPVAAGLAMNRTNGPIEAGKRAPNGQDYTKLGAACRVGHRLQTFLA